MEQDAKKYPGSWRAKREDRLPDRPALLAPITHSSKMADASGIGGLRRGYGAGRARKRSASRAERFVG